MESVHGAGLTSEQSQLLGVVRGVRNRYRAKRALRGAAIAVALTWAVFAAMAYAMSVFKYSDASVLWGRVIDDRSRSSAAVVLVRRPSAAAQVPRRAGRALSRGTREEPARVGHHGRRDAEERRARQRRRCVRRRFCRVSRTTRSSACTSAGDGKAIDAGELKTNGAIFAAGDRGRDRSHGVWPGSAAPRNQSRRACRGRPPRRRACSASRSIRATSRSPRAATS